MTIDAPIAKGITKDQTELGQDGPEESKKKIQGRDLKFVRIDDKISLLALDSPYLLVMPVTALKC